MNKIIVPLLVIAGVIFAVYFFGVKGSLEPLSEAVKLENSGNYSRALDLYISALTAMADNRSLPSKSQAMASSPDAWKKELDTYLTWLIAPKSYPSSSFQTAADAIDRCGKHVETANSISEMKIVKATLPDYQKAWNAIFFPAGKAAPESQETVIEKAIDTSVSILTLIGNTSYRYEGCVINRMTEKRMDFSVYNDGRFSLLAPPGNYFLFVTGKAVFPNGQVWISGVSALQLTVPDSTSLLTVKLKTDVKRQS